MWEHEAWGTCGGRKAAPLLSLMVLQYPVRNPPEPPNHLDSPFFLTLAINPQL